MNSCQVHWTPRALCVLLSLGRRISQNQPASQHGSVDTHSARPTLHTPATWCTGVLAHPAFLTQQAQEIEPQDKVSREERVGWEPSGPARPASLARHWTAQALGYPGRHLGWTRAQARGVDPAPPSPPPTHTQTDTQARDTLRLGARRSPEFLTRSPRPVPHLKTWGAERARRPRDAKSHPAKRERDGKE